MARLLGQCDDQCSGRIRFERASIGNSQHRQIQRAAAGRTMLHDGLARSCSCPKPYESTHFTQSYKSRRNPAVDCRNESRCFRIHVVGLLNAAEERASQNRLSLYGSVTVAAAMAARGKYHAESLQAVAVLVDGSRAGRSIAWRP